MGHHQSIRQAHVSSLHQYCIRKEYLSPNHIAKCMGTSTLLNALSAKKSGIYYKGFFFFFKKRKCRWGNEDEEICETEYRRNGVSVDMLAALAHYNRVIVFKFVFSKLSS